ncbi:MAG: hypothetical protein IJ193_03500 [Bacilli bacterium]|nr:hypothetical protein [Bacilli bacterium]
MNSGQIMKWFMDHNEILKRKEDLSRRNYLTFIACVLLKNDEEVSFEEENIIISSGPEKYSFDKDTELFLRCLNRYLGYYNELFFDSGFVYLKSKGITKFRGKYFELYDIFFPLRESIDYYKNYDFDKKVYYNGYNTFFYPEDMELTDEEFALFQKHYTNQSAIEVYRSDGKIIMY